MKGYNVQLWWIRYLFAFVLLVTSINVWLAVISFIQGQAIPEDVVSNPIFCLFSLGILNGVTIWAFRLVIRSENHGYVFLITLDGDLKEENDPESRHYKPRYRQYSHQSLLNPYSLEYKITLKYNMHTF